jgi:hypothetical protein
VLPLRTRLCPRWITVVVDAILAAPGRCVAVPLR